MRPANLQPHESAIYSELSHLYDQTFGRVFYRRIVSVVRALDIPAGAHVLEVGVGTGLTLDGYPTHCDVTGIDLSPEMLARARQRVQEHGWTHVTLLEGDALNLRFRDATFDHVTAFHVVSVVPDPARMMREIRRVCRPGGSITLINHFRSTAPGIARVQAAVDPIFRRLGWTTLELETVLAGSGLTVQRVWKTSPLSLFTVVQAERPQHEADGTDTRLAPAVAVGGP